MARQPRTTTSADSVWVVPCSSTQRTPVAFRPACRTATTHDRGRSSAPASSALRSGASAPTRAWIGQPKPLHCPQSLHAGRPPCSTLLIAIGTGNGCSAGSSFLQPSTSSSDECCGGPSGMGRALVRGACFNVVVAGSWLMSPATPMSASTSS